jgi:hypothetical protein
VGRQTCGRPCVRTATGNCATKSQCQRQNQRRYTQQRDTILQSINQAQCLRVQGRRVSQPNSRPSTAAKDCQTRGRTMETRSRLTVLANLQGLCSLQNSQAACAHVQQERRGPSRHLELRTDQERPSRQMLQCAQLDNRYMLRHAASIVGCPDAGNPKTDDNAMSTLLSVNERCGQRPCDVD